MPATSEGSRWRLATAALLAAALVVVSVLLALSPVVQRWSGDVRLFQHYASIAVAGDLGSTPFLSWYPPMSLVPLGLPLLAGGMAAYTFALGVEMALVAGAGALVLSGFGSDGAQVRREVWLFAALALLATALFAWRYDLVPAVLTLGSAWAAPRRRWALAGVLLGAAAGLKVYAAVLAPLLLVHAWRQDGSRSAVLCAIAGSAAGVGALALYALFPASSPLDLLAFTANRPLQLETIPGSVIAGLTALGATTTDIRFGSGSFNLHGDAAELALGLLRLIQPLILFASLWAGAYAILRGSAAEPHRVLVVAWLATLLGLIISNRVLSPQYLVWMLPLVPLVSGTLLRLLVACIGLTAALFPWLYESLLELDAFPVTVVLLRNVLLIWAWAVAMFVLARWPTEGVPPSRAAA